ncbi:methyltransferase domain-containing protein [Candidatus Dojkabacteria bacterium]|uniref:Methyltransferase domain-containing protein n=1 Tax=Candidatus Dojkabacteria bacterium TaxID=2099670 RepID=A0A955L6X0_9BACT|nr:methyltransferase domain-containing protein [Candidatus Dojkabacteria bacterium]
MKNQPNATISAYNQYADQYSKKYKTLRYTKKYLDYFIDNASGTTLLDIGCGHGRDSFYLSDAGFDVTGIDGSSEMISIAKQQISSCKFECCLFKDIGYEENSFDNIWASASLLHLTKIEFKAILSKIRKILKPGGLFYLSMQEGEGEIVQNVSVVEADRLFTRYNISELEQLLSEAGFSIDTYERNDQHKVVIWLAIFAR